MTLNKNAVRKMLEEFFSDYGPDQRFILNMDHFSIKVSAQPAKERIPHPKQAFLGDD